MRKSSSACQVYAVASEDMDSLTFGASRFLRHLMDPSSKKIPVMEFDISQVKWSWTLSIFFVDVKYIIYIAYLVADIRGART